MGLRRIPTLAYNQLAKLLGLRGGFGIKGIHDEVFPTQEMNRLLQLGRVHRTLFITRAAVAADVVTLSGWSDFSTWSEVITDGIPVTGDAGMPMASNDRMIVFMALTINATIADYVGLTIARELGDVGLDLALLGKWGANTGGGPYPDQIGVNLLPVMLDHREARVEFTKDVSGAGSGFIISIEMLDAEPGLLPMYPGV